MDPVSEPSNPVTYIRKALGISRAEIARRTGCGYGMLAHVELGYDPQIAGSVLDALEILGLPRDDAQRMYVEWRETFRQDPATAAG